MSQCSPIIIPPFPAVSLTTDEGTWLSRDAWEEREHEFFAERSEAYRYGLFSPPVKISYRSRDPNPALQRWVLRAKAAPNEPIISGRPLAWAELQGFHRLFDVFWVFVGPHVDGWESPRAAESLRALVSGILITGGSDLLRVTGTPGSHVASVASILEAELRATDDHDISSVWTPRRDHWATPEGVSAGLSTSVLLVQPGTWWKTPSGERHRQTFAHLAGRYNPHPPCDEPKRRGSLLQTLFQFGQWKA